MEYSKRRRHRRPRRAAQRKTQQGDGGRVIVALLMVALIVYFVSASSAGTWVAKNVMAPALEALDSLELWGAKKDPDTNTPTTGGDDAVLQVNLSGDQSARNSANEDITLPAVSCYMLQMGVFSSQANADMEAASLKSSGGAGYVLEDEGRYRVLAAGYDSESAAKDVKTRLVAEGTDCTVYALSANAAVFRVTANSDQLADIEKGFTALFDAQQALTLAALEFDQKSQSAEDGRGAAQQILANLRADMAILSQYDGDNSMFTALLACYTGCESALSSLSQSAASSTSTFASQLKHTQLYVTHQYAQFLRGIQG